MDNSSKVGFVPAEANNSWNYGDLQALTQKEMDIEPDGNEQQPSGMVTLDNTTVEQLYPQNVAQADAIKAVQWKSEAPDLPTRIGAYAVSQNSAKAVMGENVIGNRLLQNLSEIVATKQNAEKLIDLKPGEIKFLTEAAYKEFPDLTARAYLISHRDQIADLAVSGDFENPALAEEARDLLFTVAAIYGRGGGQEITELSSLIPGLLHTLKLAEETSLGARTEMEPRLKPFSKNILDAVESAILDSEDVDGKLASAYVNSIGSLITRKIIPVEGAQNSGGIFETRGAVFYSKIISEQNGKVSQDLLHAANTWAAHVLVNESNYPLERVSRVVDALILAKDIPSFPRGAIDDVLLTLATERHSFLEAQGPIRELANEYFIERLEGTDTVDAASTNYAIYVIEHQSEIDPTTVRRIRETMFSGALKSSGDYPEVLVKLLERILNQ